MSPKHRMITTVWCAITMVATVIVSHGHLIMREIMTHWPQSDSWEGRLENALYTQGGLVFAASFVIGFVLMIRSYFVNSKNAELARKELAQREKHDRAAEKRHEALLAALKSPESGSVESGDGGRGANRSAKKSATSGMRPR